MEFLIWPLLVVLAYGMAIRQMCHVPKASPDEAVTCADPVINQPFATYMVVGTKHTSATITQSPWSDDASVSVVPQETKSTEYQGDEITQYIQTRDIERRVLRCTCASGGRRVGPCPRHDAV